MSDTNTEIELKLALVKGNLAQAKRAIGDIHLDKTAIEDVYFDTPDANLRRRGLVLRLRRDGDRWLQTLKAASNGHSVVPVRGEWEVALPARRSAPTLDLERFEITPLRVLLRAGLEADSLVPVFRTRISRQRGMLVHGTSQIEVALDRGELRARVEGRKRRQPVAEVELELKSGRPQDLLDVGSELVKQGHGMTLVPALRSKAERGYGLAARDGLGAARASAGGFAERLRVEMPSAQALREVIRHGLALVVANADALRGDPASEHVHQARVSLRRMRSAIRSFDPYGEDFPVRLSKGLHWLAQTLGAARDWDVIVEQTLPRSCRRCPSTTRTSGGRAAQRGESRRGRSGRPWPRSVRVAMPGSCSGSPAGPWKTQPRRRAVSARWPRRCWNRQPTGSSRMRARSAASASTSATASESTRSGCATPSTCSRLRCPAAGPPTTSKRWPRFRTPWAS